MKGAARKPAQTGIVPRKYKSGSIIYFESDRSEYIYILKSGRVFLTSVKPDTGEEVKEEVRQGEFFGVKSSLGKYPREETAQTIGDTVVLVMPLADFERLILRNVNVVRKMLRVFSNQLRRIHKMVRSVLGDSEDINPEVELFRVGEHYYRQGHYKRAEYSYKRYLEYYPDTQYSSVAMKRIRAIDSGSAVPEDADPELHTHDEDTFTAPPVEAPASSIDDASEDFTDFDEESHDDSNADTGGGTDDFGIDSSPSESVRSPLSDEMDDFLSGPGGEPGADSGDGLDNFSFDEPGGSGSEDTIFEMSSRVDELMAGSDFTAALELSEKITARAGEAARDDEKGVIERAAFTSGTSMSKLGNLKGALGAFSRVIKEYPSGDYAKSSLFGIGEIFEKARKNDKAISYYTKVMNMSPKDSLSSQAFDRIKKLQH